MNVQNASRGISLGSAIDIADTSAKRRTGLLKHTELAEGHGLWIVPCEAVHMFGMKFAIDVIFLSRSRKVLKIRKELGRWRMAMCLRAHSVLELPAGTVEKTGTQVGDQLEFEK